MERVFAIHALTTTTINVNVVYNKQIQYPFAGNSDGSSSRSSSGSMLSIRKSEKKR